MKKNLPIKLYPMFTEDVNEEKPNYPHQDDTAFTPDEVEAIKAYKANLETKINKNESIRKGLEQGFWSLTSYSVAKFLVLTSGMNGAGLAVGLAMILNNIVNRDCLDSLNINFENGFKVDGMGKLVKFGFSSIVSFFVIWSALGNFYQTASQSKETYQKLQNTVENFNKLPNDQQNKWLVIGGLIGLAGVYTVIDSRGRR